jgi:ABC-type polar amino acid transport system ATPase subunit
MAVILERKTAFVFQQTNIFQTIEEAESYCENVLKSVIKKNKKAESDFRPNAYGVQELPWFKIDGEVYNSPNDRRIKNTKNRRY